MKFVFFGSGTFGLPTLRTLWRNQQGHELVLIVTQPDRPAGRRRRLTPTPIAAWATQQSLPTLKTDDVNAPASVEQITAAAGRVHTLVVIAFGQKLGPELIGRRLAINLHGSLLPKYRGAAPVSRVMMANESETGVTVIRLADRMDAGSILGAVPTPIHHDEIADQLHDRLADLGPDLVMEVLAEAEAGTLQPREQDEALASSAPKLTKADGTVEFDAPCDLVRARIHALNSWPGCTVLCESRTIKLGRVRDRPDIDVSNVPGTVLADRTIACRTGILEILEIQPPGGNMMSFASFVNGHELDPGQCLKPLAASDYRGS